MNAQLAAAAPQPIPMPLTLQHYPAAPVLRPYVNGYFSVEGPIDPEALQAAAEGEAVLLCDLGAHPLAWMLRPGRLREHAFVGPLFGALLQPGVAERLTRGDADAGFSTQRLLLQLRAAPSMAFRIVALDRYLIARLVAPRDV
jgi:hypothetical protein